MRRGPASPGRCRGVPCPGSRGGAISHLPSGTVTFVFTDIEGSTRLWEQSPEAMRLALRRHDDQLASLVSEHGGHLFASTGDGIAAAFDRVEHALAAAVAIQRSPREEGAVSLRIRVVVNTGEAEERSGNYFGPVLNETARLLGSGHGGQILVAGVSQQILGSRLPDGLALLDLGEHRLRDIARPVRIFQVAGPGLPDGFPPLRGSDAGRPLLPASLTELVGRDQDLRALTKALSDHRLVTLVGAGGCGKTRLAVEVAMQIEESTREPAWFVELAPVAEPSLVAETLGAVIGASSGQETGDLDPILSFLRSSRGLILLDNCEHLVAEVSRVAAAVLRECPLVRILATSREPLNLLGEVVYPVQPLRTPPEDASAADLLAFDSVRLFEARAADSRPGFAVNATNAAAVNRICRRLDGIPLGLELAAARLRVLPIDEIARRLDASLAILGTAGRDVVPHHRTLEATLDWSYELLDPPERELLSYLAVFAGGWTLEAMEAVWPGGSGLDLLVALVDKSLVSVAEEATPSRYRLLEPIRQYARGKLAAAGIESDARQRHADHHAALTERAFLEMWGSREAEWLDRLDVEVDNLREALTWFVEAGSSPAGQAMAGALVFLWSRTNRLSEAITWQQRVLAGSSEEGSARARALLLSNLHILEDAEYHHGLLAEAVRLYRQHGPDRELALALLFDASHTVATGEWQAAMTEYEEAVHIADAIGHGGILAVAASELASVSAVWAGDLERAIPLATRAVDVARHSGSRHILHNALAGAADLEEARGALETAEMLLIEAQGIEGEGRWAGSPGLALARLAEIALAQGRLDLAMARLDQQHRQIVEVIDYGEMWAQGQALRDQLRIRGELEVRRGSRTRGVTLLSAYLALRGVTRVDEARQSRVDAALASAAEAVGEADFAIAWERGRSMTMRGAVDYVWDDPAADRGR